MRQTIKDKVKNARNITMKVRTWFLTIYYIFYSNDSSGASLGTADYSIFLNFFSKLSFNRFLVLINWKPFVIIWFIFFSFKIELSIFLFISLISPSIKEKFVWVFPDLLVLELIVDWAEDFYTLPLITTFGLLEFWILWSKMNTLIVDSLLCTSILMNLLMLTISNYEVE